MLWIKVSHQGMGEQYTSILLHCICIRLSRRKLTMSFSTYFSHAFLALMFAAVLQISHGAPTGQPTSAPPTLDPSLVRTLQLYYNTNLEMAELRQNEKTAYDEYKLDRFSDLDVIVPPMDLDGLPDLSGLTNADRFAMNESDILELHRSSLIAYGQFMIFVTIDESESDSPTDFGPQFNTIRARLARVVAGIEALMNHLNFSQNGLPTPPFVSMAPEHNVSMRITRDLYVLQEMYTYLAVADYDLRIRYLRHAFHASSQ